MWPLAMFRCRTVSWDGELGVSVALVVVEGVYSTASVVVEVFRSATTGLGSGRFSECCPSVVIEIFRYAMIGLVGECSSECCGLLSRSRRMPCTA